MAAELTLKTLRKLRRDLIQPVQRKKLEAWADYVVKGQAEFLLPDDDNVTSYVTSTNQKNRYVGTERFAREMARSFVKTWDKRFILVGSSEDTRKRIAEAARWANQQVIIRTLAYPRGESTGHLKSMISTSVNGVGTKSPAQQILKSPYDDPVFEISNYAEYGSTAEARSYYSAQRGIIYYVASRLQRKYPDLGIVFYYANGQGIALPHKYEVPVLRISTPANTNFAWSRPGENARRRKKAYQRINRRLKGV